ncbi:unnamed protein product [Adineta ricciae]|uniref:Uncharacterized protein n=1 Tax=Adineta ricciae TaxID=249248 RepID=A0A815UBP7_ADIRI|nr:unnamed protein product [Adineta ricciae]
MAIDLECFNQQMERARLYVQYIVQLLEDAGKIASPYDESHALKVVKLILHKLSYSGEKTPGEFLAETHSFFHNVQTNEQLISMIIKSHSLVTVIDTDKGKYIFFYSQTNRYLYLLYFEDSTGWLH